ncbi:hypothetical protein [Peribacillus asahii]|uniref:hypothetical protein n=1 Tax=Peribacillus asahii TaxID=228899 RepID=UPI0038163B88
MKVLVVKGMWTGHNRRTLSGRNVSIKNRFTTDKVHLSKSDKEYTVCGVYIPTSETLNHPETGDLGEVNCKRCLNYIKKNF